MLLRIVTVKNVWFVTISFLIIGKFQNSVCNGSHDLRMLTLSINDIGIITVKRVDCRYLIHDISNTEAIYLLKIAVLDNRGYI